MALMARDGHCHILWIDSLREFARLDVMRLETVIAEVAKPRRATTGLLTIGCAWVLMMWLSRSRTAPAGGVRPPTQTA